VVSVIFGLFGWLPGRRAAAQKRRRAHRKALAGLEFAAAELGSELRRLADHSQSSEPDDVAAVVRETTATSRILDLLARGERFAANLSKDEAASAWREVAASAGRARLLGQGPHRVARLRAVAEECEQLQQFIDEGLRWAFRQTGNLLHNCSVGRRHERPHRQTRRSTMNHMDLVVAAAGTLVTVALSSSALGSTGGQADVMTSPVESTMSELGGEQLVDFVVSGLASWTRQGNHALHLRADRLQPGHRASARTRKETTKHVREDRPCS